MYSFKNTLTTFIVCTALTAPVLTAELTNLRLYQLLIILLGATWPPTTPWGFITAVFMHPTVTDYVFDMLTLWLLGPFFETTFGARLYWITFMTSGIASSLSTALFYLMGTPVVLGGSSGALFGLVGFLLMTPERGVIISNPINILIIAFLLSPLALEFGIAYLGHLLGFITGIIIGTAYMKQTNP